MTKSNSSNNRRDIQSQVRKKKKTQNKKVEAQKQEKVALLFCFSPGIF